MAAKGAFICKNCRTAFNATGFWSGVNDKYKCSKHELCSDCVDHTLTGYRCVKCKGNAIRYEFNKSYGKWVKA